VKNGGEFGGDEVDLSCYDSQLDYSGAALAERTDGEECTYNHFCRGELSLESIGIIPCRLLIGGYKGRECSLRMGYRCPKERNMRRASIPGQMNSLE
jgi:hypothetical protein